MKARRVKDQDDPSEQEMSDESTDSQDLFDRLFVEAKNLPESEWQAFLNQHCDDEVMREELRNLLAAAAKAPRGEIDNPILPDDAVVKSFEAADIETTRLADYLPLALQAARGEE